MSKEKVIIGWSGGKDSSLALQAVSNTGDLDVVALVTTVTDEYDRISMHGVRRSLLHAQAEAIDAAVVGIDGQLAGPHYFDLCNQAFWNAAQAEAPGNHAHSVAQAIHCRSVIGYYFVKSRHGGFCSGKVKKECYCDVRFIIYQIALRAAVAPSCGAGIAVIVDHGAHQAGSL